MKNLHNITVLPEELKLLARQWYHYYNGAHPLVLINGVVHFWQTPVELKEFPLSSQKSWINDARRNSKLLPFKPSMIEIK